MREIFTSGSVGRAPGNRCLYPEIDTVYAVRIAVSPWLHFTAIRPSYTVCLSLALEQKKPKTMIPV